MQLHSTFGVCRETTKFTKISLLLFVNSCGVVAKPIICKETFPAFRAFEGFFHCVSRNMMSQNRFGFKLFLAQATGEWRLQGVAPKVSYKRGKRGYCFITKIAGPNS